MTTIASDKRALRGELRRRLGAIDPVTRQRAAAELRDRVLSLPEIESARHVFTCLSFGSEIDTWSLVDGLLDARKRVYVPRADFATRRLLIHPYPCELVELDMGLRQPAEEEEELPPEAIDGTLDVALIAGLAFDRSGYRLGHGGGFFDRFLIGRPFPAIGLAYHLQVVDRVPREAHDRAVQAIATDRETIRPESGSSDLEG